MSIDPYKDAGVDTEKGDQLADWLSEDKNQKSFIHPKGLGKVTSGIGGFAGLFEVNFKHMSNPQLVASTDGVGTKLLLGLQQEMIDDLGQDLVAMCANDLYTIGATPLFFLDYYATGALSSDQFKQVLSSIQSSCKVCSMALLGGETAEMPGLYEKGHFDLAGFIVGVVDEKKRLGSHKTKEGDVLISLQSSGFHSNGFSLIRKWLKDHPKLASQDLVKNLMKPTRLYPEIVDLALKFETGLASVANITGGGISGNLPRVVSDDLDSEIKFSDLPTETWMKNFILDSGSTLKDVEPVFNLGVGMIAVVDKKEAENFVKTCAELNLKPTVIGKLVSGKGPSKVIYI